MGEHIGQVDGRLVGRHHGLDFEVDRLELLQHVGHLERVQRGVVVAGVLGPPAVQFAGLHRVEGDHVQPEVTGRVLVPFAGLDRIDQEYGWLAGAQGGSFGAGCGWWNGWCRYRAGANSGWCRAMTSGKARSIPFMTFSP